MAVRVTADRLSAALTDRYRIERELGQGGMATVYLAADLKHDRKVALKVLKPELAAVLGAERFVVEIKTTASLQHPHILPLFDSGTADGFLFYVMPFIEGETLRDRLNRETQLGVDEAVRIAREVADALDYAHGKGVIHRDIKPENILLANGRPMVADFGIALAVSAAAGGRMTETGLSLGTPHYMSPEQATAEKEISARSDVYSLASVLFEMLAGEPPHSGGSAQAIIMKIIAEPAQDVTKFRKTVPPNVAAAVAKALEKVPADRFESAKAFADALGNRGFTNEGQRAVAATGPAVAGAFSRFALVGMTTIAILASAGAIGGWIRSRPPPPPPSVRYQLSLFPGSTGDGNWRHLALSPLGTDVVFTSSRSGSSMLWLKTRDGATAEPLAGTDGGVAATFSPDGEWIVFAAGSRLRKMRLDGRDATTIADGVAPGSGSTAWLDDGTVLFTGERFDLSAVGPDGRTRVVIPRDSLPNNVLDIAAVPGSRSALVVTCASNCVQAELWAVNLGSGERRRLAERAIRVWFVTGGLAVYGETQTGRVFAAPYDERSLSFAEPATPVFEDVRRSGGEGIHMAVSDNGTLLYAPAIEAERFQAVWFTRDGRSTPVDSSWSFVPASAATVSPDGKRLAVAIDDGRSSDIWLKELAPGGGLSRLTFTGDVRSPEWTHDGNALIYMNVLDASRGGFLRRRSVQGTDSGRTLLQTARNIASVALPRDTSRMLLRFGPPVTRDIYLWRVGTASADSLVPLLANDRQEEVAMNLSPDERWLAYTSDESGRFEVYVVPFPDVKADKWQVSVAGGRSPRWARSGKELFFRDLTGGLFAVPVTVGSIPTFGDRRLLFRPEGIRSDPMSVQFDVSPDDRRFLFLQRTRREGEETTGTTILIQGWLTDVRERLKGTR
jgi:Tol biopolymer transport system component/tRNA A-37 threonylcarbamoyl transferase component Bud32